MKLALEKLHTPKAKHTFQIFTDNKSLEYLKILTLGKPGGPFSLSGLTFWCLVIQVLRISRVYPEEENQSYPETIHPKSCYINTIQWDFDREI